MKQNEGVEGMKSDFFTYNIHFAASWIMSPGVVAQLGPSPMRCLWVCILQSSKRLHSQVIKYFFHDQL